MRRQLCFVPSRKVEREMNGKMKEREGDGAKPVKTVFGEGNGGRER